MVPLGANGAEVVAAGLVWQAILFATGGLGALVLMLSGFRLRPYENSNV
jgi:endo-1,4-beta-mannosidase